MEEGSTTWQKLKSLSTVGEDATDPKDFMAKATGWAVNYKPVTVGMEDGSTITGKVNIRSFARLSDFLNASGDKFIAVVRDEDYRTRRVAMLNKSHIESFLLERGAVEESKEWEVNFKRVTIKMSDGSVFTGKMNIRNFQRLSDFFRGADDRFVVVVSDEDQPQRVLMVNKNYIIWAEAAE
jgi:hypothetical protein